MGFKRTSEGRVFFQNPEPETETQDNVSIDTPVGGKELQILGLLRALNDRLKNLQMERSRMVKDLGEYRDLVGDLEERLGRSEEAYIDLEQKLALRQNEHSKKITRAEKVIKDTIQDVMDAKSQLETMEQGGGVTAEQFTALKEQLAKLSVSQDSEAGKRIDALEKLYKGLQQTQKDQGEKMVDQVAAYVSLAKRVNEAEGRFDEQDNKIAESNERQERLERKIEKATQDRTRMLRKVDRIEEAVMQMRDALNAKAMVVLTDTDQVSEQPHKAKAKSPIPQDPEFKPWLQDSKEENANSEESPLQAGKPVLLQEKVDDGVSLEGIKSALRSPYAKITVVTIIGAALLASAINVTVRDADTGFNTPVIVTQDFAGANVERIDATMPEEPLAAPPEPVDVTAQLSPSALDLPPVSEQELVQDDIGTLPLDDDARLLQLLSDDPEGLAQGLNAIEPGEIEDMQLSSLAPAEPVTEPEQQQQPTPPVAQERPVIEPEDIPAPTSATVSVDIQPDPDLPEAVKGVEAQALQGVPEAQHDLAAVYTAGHAGVTQNFERAALWFKKAAEQGVANAAYNMGVIHHQGLGMQPNTDEAIRWYAQAAQNNHPEAQYNLAIAYIEGIGVGYNPSQAAEYFENAANQGIVEAAYNLGLIYENGLTGKVEPDKALSWYKFAADKGSPEAKSALEQLAKTLGIGLGEVNDIVEDMETGNLAPAQTQSVKKNAVAPVEPAKDGILAKKTAATTTNTLPQQQAPRLASVSPSAGQGDDRQVILTSEIQKHLIRLGLYPGPADGISGPLTRDAIRSYQNATNLPTNGEVSDELLDHMASLALFGEGGDFITDGPQTSQNTFNN